MKTAEIASLLNASVHNDTGMDINIDSACGSDLMSDVMAYARDNVMLLTGLVNPQVIRTAEMMDIKAVIFVRGKVPGPGIICLAREKGIIVMSTPDAMFTACGKLYSAGVKGKAG